MEAILHKQVLRKNKWERAALSMGVQDKMDIYKRLRSRLNLLKGGHHKALTKQLKTLDEELYYDILGEKEDELDNNEITYIKEKELPSLTQQEVEPKQEKVSVKPKLKNEMILEELWKMKRTENLTRSTLLELGMNCELTDWEIKMGDYTLKRTAMFRYVFDLEKSNG